MTIQNIFGRLGPACRTAVLVCVAFAVFPAAGEAPGIRYLRDDELPGNGRDLYNAACAVCHGIDGAGAPAARVGAVAPLPDFTDCTFATREADFDWIAVALRGGPVRAFRKHMPAFGDALTRDQLEKIMAHIRTFCANDAWPRGELNLPRPQVTTKAYPEDEAVIEFGYEGEGADTLSATLLYEKRFGARNQWEIAVPYSLKERLDGNDTDWDSGVGDVAFGLKRVLFSSLETGSILSLAGEVFLPTGDEGKGFGRGTAFFEPYLAYGQILPADCFLQAQTGIGIPWDDDEAEEEAFWRLALGHQYNANRYGRRWSPIVELLGSRELASGAGTHWDLVPQLQVTLSDRQHVRLSAGVRLPLDNADARETEVLVYVLWDWFDGGLLEGW